MKNELSCKQADSALFKQMNVILTALELKKTVYFLEETRCDGSFLYNLENKKLDVAGYVGRDVETGKIVYVGIDRTRIRWGELEGFAREECFERAGVLMKLRKMEDFILYISGSKEYTIESRFTIEKPAKSRNS